VLVAVSLVFVLGACSLLGGRIAAPAPELLIGEWTNPVDGGAFDIGSDGSVTFEKVPLDVLNNLLWDITRSDGTPAGVPQSGTGTWTYDGARDSAGVPYLLVSFDDAASIGSANQSISIYGSGDDRVELRISLGDPDMRDFYILKRTG